MAQRKVEEQEAPGIVVLFTSLMILLLAFFIMMNSMSKTEETKVVQVYQSLQGSFGFSPGGASPIKAIVEPRSSSYSAPINPVEQDYQMLRGLVVAEAPKGQVKLLRSQKSKTLRMTGALLFPPDSMKLTAKGKEFLTQVAGIIKVSDYPISIVGNTDDAPAPRGMNNWGFSARRAMAVLNFLVSKGVADSRLAAFGRAQFDPIAPNTSAHNRRLNNRVDLIFSDQDSAYSLVPEGKQPPKADFRGFSFDLKVKD